MGFDFEGILGTSGAGLAEAYEDTIANVIYFDEPIEGLRGHDPAPIITGDTDPGGITS